MDIANINNYTVNKNGININNNAGIFGAIIAIIGVIIALIFTTHKPLTSKLYVVNTYLYILLAILLCSLIILMMDKYNILKNINTMGILVVFIILIVVMCAMSMIDRKYVVLRHILWVVFIVCIAVILLPVYETAKYTDVLWKSLMTVIIIVLILTFIAAVAPRNYFRSWGTYLSIGLIALIVFEILDLIFSDKNSFFAHQKIYGIIGVLLFSGFVLYDTGNVYSHADDNVILCQGITNQYKCTDYPGESLGLFIDIINLFSSTTMAQQ